MSESQRTGEKDCRRPLRVRRQAAGVVAQYIRELSDQQGELESPDVVGGGSA
jgi:hypothetical protein